MITCLIGRDLDQYIGRHCFRVKKRAFLCHSLIPFETASKKNEYSTDLQSLVIQHFLKGNSYAVIAKKVLIPRPSSKNTQKNKMHLESLRSRSKTKNYNFC